MIDTGPAPREANSSFTASVSVPNQKRSAPSDQSNDDLRQQAIDAVHGYWRATSQIPAPFNDELTGLRNRNGFLAIVDGALDGPRGRGLGVALVDLNDFAAFNDAFGHDKGDALLRAVAGRLAAQVTDAIVVARIGNDVFGVLYPSEVNIAEDVHRAVRAACARAGAGITITCSIGTATTDHGVRSGSEVLRRASIALTTSKRTGPGRQACFNTDMGTLTVKRVTLLQHLHNALPQCQLSVVYQPQVDLNDDSAIGVEALMRWSTSDGSSISPTQFIPLAESAGLIVAFGEWILEEACLELRALHRLGGPLLRMAVNVSPIQFESEGFVPSVLRIVQETGVDPRYLELEVTESTTMKNPDSVFRQLTDLRRHGISVAIDDFGTGHSCLGSLRNLPVSRLKLDQSFVQDVVVSELGTSIAQLVVNLGRSLNLEVVAEGIETRATAQALKRMGCQVGQGFYFASPMDATALRAWLALRRKIAA